jgi:hypothetical protein
MSQNIFENKRRRVIKYLGRDTEHFQSFLLEQYKMLLCFCCYSIKLESIEQTNFVTGGLLLIIFEAPCF